ncbi:hypothetical protein F5I97DRAFT_3386 [Phlebopus sp. FC_14]|nr:hypothetical protein F5I97DRAFT_3386 [Phlebopus sp. FC_14]
MLDLEIEVLTAQLSALQRREDDFGRVLEDMARLQNCVKEEKVALGSKILELKSQRNPINWLPSELLIQIFLAHTEDDSAEIATGLPYNPAPILISQVCRKWRDIALSTSRLWSFISYTSSEWRASPLKTFLQRSGNSLITFNFLPPLSQVGDQDATALATKEYETARNIVIALTPQLARFRSITFECGSAKSVTPILDAINRLSHKLDNLKSLDLALGTQDPSFEGTSLLIWDELPRNSLAGRPSPLTHLRLQQLPLFILSGSLIRTIRSLELSYHPRKSPAIRLHRLGLRMSHLVRLLHHTPELHELSMIGVTPLWDIITKVPSNSSTSRSTLDMPKLVTPFELSDVQHLRWKFAYHRDLFPFMALVILPKLSRWDLLIAQSPAKRYEASQFRGNHVHDQDSYVQSEPLANVLTLSVLKELNVSCQHEDTLASSLRQFLFPALEKLDISFVGHHLRKEPFLPSLSRLESIFRDPRLPCLTHLAITSFDILPGYGRSMLGYMPNLVSLTVGSCTGVSDILAALAESYGRVAPMQGRRAGKACGVRVCPRLDELVLWSCPDFDFKTLFAAVYARADVDDRDVPPEVVVEADVASAVLGRKIRPLKKLRNTGASQTQDVDTSPRAAGSSVSTLIPIQEALHPTPITCVHLENCPQIGDDAALSLEELGTVVMIR